MTTTVRDLLAGPAPTVSFEFFPPKTEEGAQRLWTAIRELEPLRPSFVSVTYGAGGSTRDRTLGIVARMVRETSLTPVAHLTCVGASREELRETLADLAEAGVRNLLALRGDPPSGPQAAFTPHPEGLSYAIELVELAHEIGGFCVGVAAFPDVHPESPDRESDLDHLAAKCAAGADFAITQFFFDAAAYIELVEGLRARGCATPVVPGIMPITNVAQIERFAALSGTPLPADLVARLRAVADDQSAVRAIGVQVASDLTRELLDLGAPGVHLYTLNSSTATREVWARLSDHPRMAEAVAGRP